MSGFQGETLAEIRSSYDARIARAYLRLERAIAAANAAARQYDSLRDETCADADMLADLRQSKFLRAVAAAAAQHELDALEDQAALSTGRSR